MSILQDGLGIIQMDENNLHERLLKEQQEILRKQDEQLEALESKGLNVLKNQINLISEEINEQNNVLEEIDENVEK